MKKSIVLAILIIVVLIFGYASSLKSVENTNKINTTKINVTNKIQNNHTTNVTKIIKLTNTTKKNNITLNTTKINISKIIANNTIKRVIMTSISKCSGDVCKYQFYKDQLQSSKFTRNQKLVFNQTLKNIAWKYLMYPNEFEVKYKIV